MTCLGRVNVVSKSLKKQKKGHLSDIDFGLVLLVPMSNTSHMGTGPKMLCPCNIQRRADLYF